MKRLFLLRYDTERPDGEAMKGFLEKVVEVHRAEEIPSTFFCTGKTLDGMEKEFKAFHEEVKDDPLFDLQNHSYNHIGLGYTEGMSVENLKADYEKSFTSHERVFGCRPKGVSICGTGGRDGKRLQGFDETEKGKQELVMMAGLGMKMINSHLVGVDEHREFVSYARVGFPDIMGFPSSYSDTGWMRDKPIDEAMDFVYGKIKEHADRDDPMPLMLHDWMAWLHADDQELTHVKRFAEYARKHGYELATHVACYENGDLWRGK